MQLMRRTPSWDPFHEFEELSNRFTRLFGLAPRGNGEREDLTSMSFAPACDITETDKEYRVRAELPNVKREDVHVTLEDGLLTIQGERREEKEEKSAKRHRRELTYGHFLRRFSMPADADEAKVEATFKDGMLNVSIAKSPAKASKAKEIAVH